jgi:hypothetical protein
VAPGTEWLESSKVLASAIQARSGSSQLARNLRAVPFVELFGRYGALCAAGKHRWGIQMSQRRLGRGHGARASRFGRGVTLRVKKAAPRKRVTVRVAPGP